MTGGWMVATHGQCYLRWRSKKKRLMGFGAQVDAREPRGGVEGIRGHPGSRDELRAHLPGV